MKPEDLRQAIADTGDTIANFASRVGVTTGTMTVWLKGPRPIRKVSEYAIKAAVETYKTEPPTRIMWSGPK